MLPAEKHHQDIREHLNSDSASLFWHDLIATLTATRMLTSRPDPITAETQLLLARTALRGEILARAYRFVEKHNPFDASGFEDAEIDLSSLLMRRVSYARSLFSTVTQTGVNNPVSVQIKNDLLLLYIDCLLFSLAAGSGLDAPVLDYSADPKQISFTINTAEFAPPDGTGPYQRSWHFTYDVCMFLASALNITTEIKVMSDQTVYLSHLSSDE
ncbi:MAG: hypothetical protein TR69_WS6001000219 [candidate division WS6 bacterium OLB20]|uniref:Uncharacterized protein n=1 Tax=candidate division WS6 bacterium OLB20 TaxID=1617426 RepID=A0A136M0B9_9BACT|nr:MAG: hypothetical protein TR69_WS6001000219 [candidate division WS6 bacterium OLB20]